MGVQRRFVVCCLFLLLGTNSQVFAAQWRAGTARVDITPVQPIWLAGYASRKQPPTGSLHPLWAKALSLDCGEGPAVIVTLDLIGDNFGRQLADRIRAAASARADVEPARILFNFSHTHSGPVSRVNDGALVTYALDHQQQLWVQQYTQELEQKLVDLIDRSVRDLRPAILSFNRGSCGFAGNRRLQLNPNGPTDDDVPVLAVRNLDQEIFAILFGYACHTAALVGDHLEYNGDYAGFAQIALEERFPKATALFMMGCGGDLNPQPRGTVPLAQRHGRALAEAVAQALSTPVPALKERLTVRFDRVDLRFVRAPTQEELIARRGTGSVYQQRLTEILLTHLQQGRSIPEVYPFPIHVLEFGQELTLVALGGETVLDYALRLRRELPGRPLWVAGYSNEVFAYIPSERVLAEGGYEGGGAMQYFGLHGPFQAGLEDRIVECALALVRSN